MTVRVHYQANTVTLRDTHVFSPLQQVHTRRFARRAMQLQEVRSLTLDPQRSEARLTYQVPDERRDAFLARLAAVIGSDAGALDEATIPPWSADECVTFSRADAFITTLRIIAAKPGALLFSHRRLAETSSGILPRVRCTLQAIPGVLEVVTQNGDGALGVQFDPLRIDAARIVRSIEIQLVNSAPPARCANAKEVTFGISNTTLGLGTVGELLLPLATPVAASILVAINLSTAWEAVRNLSQGKAGVPLARISLLVCTLASGQVVAAALTDWSLRYWQRRSQKRLDDETRRLLGESLALPERVQVLTADEGWVSVPAARLRAGDQIQVTAAEGIAVDGEVIAGEALVDEAAVSGARFPVRKSIGDTVLAGSRLLFGQLGVKVVRAGTDTVGARIAANFASVASGFTGDATLRRRSVQITEQAVLPTLVTAGVGFVAGGGLTTMGPILRQDWISGPVLAVPMVTLHTIRAALESGVLVRSGASIQRLGESGFIVFDGDDPLLTECGVELAGMRSRLADGDTLLRHVAGAALFLGDERSLALADACRERGLAVRQPSLLSLQEGRLEVRLGEHVIGLMDAPPDQPSDIPELIAEIDGHEVARLAFRLGSRLRSAAAIHRLRKAGLETFVVSAGTEQETAALAHRLGIPLWGSELDTAGRIRFLEGLRRRGIRPVYIGRVAGQWELSEAAHVSVATDGLDRLDTEGDMVVLGRSCERLADLVELARRHDPEVLSASRMALIPNLLCVAGGFAGVFNGIAANIVANVGVMNVDRRLQRMFATAPRPSLTTRAPMVT
ncbi:P-type ATPase [Methylolobus aquaticus]